MSDAKPRCSRMDRSLFLGLGPFSPAAGHLDPVQFLFELMKRIVADLVGVAHAEDGVSRCLDRPAVNVAVLCRIGHALGLGEAMMVPANVAIIYTRIGAVMNSCSNRRLEDLTGASSLHDLDCRGS